MLFGVVVITFGLMSLVPGDPAVVLLGENATPEAVRDLRRELGLDRPVVVRLVSYVSGVLQGDLGTSIFQRQPVRDLIAARLPATAELAMAALVVATLLGGALGVAAALRRGSAVDTASMIAAQVGVAMPVFWLGILLMAWLSVSWGWFPAVGRGAPLLASALSGDLSRLSDALAHLALPALTLGLHHAAVTSRLVRGSMLETLSENYVLAARARGLASRRVVLGYALRNALVPVVSVLGGRFGTLLGSSVLTETVFGWPGLGQLAVTAISQRDLPLVQGVVIVFALMFLLLNLMVDLMYGALDPRIRIAGGEERA